MNRLNLFRKRDAVPGKLLVKNSLLNLGGMVFPLLVGILIIPFAVKGLGKEGFGILSIAWVILGYFGFFDFGLSRATTKFISETLSKGEIESIPSIFWTALIVSGSLGIVGGVVLFSVSSLLVEQLLKIPIDLVPQALSSFHIIAFSVPLILCSSSLRGVLEAFQRFDLTNSVMIPASIVSFIIPGLSYPFHLELSTVVLLLVLSQATAASIYLSVCFKILPILKTRATVNINNLKMMLAYGGWISVTNIVSPLLVYMDRFFIGALVSMASVTFYAVPYEVITRLRVFSTAITMTLFPEFSSSSVYVESGRIEMLFVRGFKFVLLIVGILVVVLFFTGQILLEQWLGREFMEQSLSLFKILAIGVLINSLAIIPLNLLQGAGKPDLTAKFHLMEFPIYMFLLWLLITHFGINGAAIAWTLRVTLDAGLLFYFAIKYYPQIILKLKINNIGRTLLLLLLLFGVMLSLDMVLADVLNRLFLLSVALLSSFFFAWYHIFDNTEKEILVSLWQRLVNSGSRKLNKKYGES